jgi:oligoendopeptidase F
MAAPLQERQLDALREDADRFIAELDEEAYRHFAGLKATYDLVPIYERHEELTTLDTALAVGASVNGGRNLRELWRFVCEGYLGSFVSEAEEKIAEAETERVQVGDEEIAYRDLRPRIANADDRGERERLERARNDATEEHNELYVQKHQVVHRETARLGAETYTDLYRGFRFPLDDLAGQCRRFLDSTESLWEEAGDRFFRKRIGVGLGEVERWDVTRAWRGVMWDPAFPKDRMVPALEATLADLGVDLRAQRNVELDLADRPNKSPRAFCVPIEVPGRVVLVIKPQGGPDDWSSLFHEAGHTEHFAHTSAALTVEERRLGDNAVTEGWAMLLEHVTMDPVWLERRLDFPRPHEYAAEGATQLLWTVRRYCAKLIYELEFHAAADVRSLQPRYVELLGDALKVQLSPSDYLADVDDSFYSSEYLRAWAFEAQLRSYLRETFGNAWFTRRDAGSLLRELWSEGQKPTADEILADVTGESLELESVADRVREALAAA